MEVRFAPGDEPDRVVAFNRQQITDAPDVELRELPQHLRAALVVVVTRLPGECGVRR